MAQHSFDTVVIGLGGMGSAALYHLACRGIPVVGFDQFAPPHTHGSSHGGTRIIRLAYYEDPSYVPLLRRAFELWDELSERAGQHLLRITGSLDVSTLDGGIFPRSLASCEMHSLRHEVLTSSDVTRRFPGYRFPDDYFALYQPDGGILDPERCVAAHLAAAARSGATMHLEERVLGVQLGGRATVVRTTGGEYTAQRVVLTAGPWTGQLLPQLRALTVPERQVVGWFEPDDAALFAADRFPVFNAQVDEGHFYGFPFDGGGVKVGRYHHLEEQVDPSGYDQAIHPRDEAVLRKFVVRYLPVAAGRMVRAETCLFTNSPDEHFIIDRLGGTESAVVVAAGFSGHGFKFCSVVGEILAELAIDGRTRHDIGLLRLGRFPVMVPGT